MSTTGILFWVAMLLWLVLGPLGVRVSASGGKWSASASGFAGLLQWLAVFFVGWHLWPLL